MDRNRAPLYLSSHAAMACNIASFLSLHSQVPFLCSARAHVLSQFAAAGVDTSRVDLLALAAANSDHLGTYSQMDISLDPFPYAGTTTTCESLYMGVPVVTLQGIFETFHLAQDQHESVMGLLNARGLCCSCCGVKAVPLHTKRMRLGEGSEPVSSSLYLLECIVRVAVTWPEMAVAVIQ